MRRTFIKICSALLLPPLLISAYALWWGIVYRLPRSADKVVDLRTNKASSQGARRIFFCAGLANNPHGFPGHAYVVWSKNLAASVAVSAGEANFKDCETLGYCPHDFWSIVPSVYTAVPGVVDDRASSGNDRNVERLIVLVDDAAFERSREACRRWDATNFRTGSRDCCAFIDFVATEIGLAVPRAQFSYPHDHILKLKTLN